MSYASWRKCDFQVHTPRDRNWEGRRPVGLNETTNAAGRAATATAHNVDTERERWAEKFVDQCSAKGLRAVALTDHHEMIMVPYAQKVIEARREIDPEFDLWLFPGMELTARGGKQCLIIFDCDLSEEWRTQARGKLGIVYADLEPRSATAPRVTQLDCAYPDIAKLLDQLDELRGKYIVLPNVSQGGSHTVLTTGAHKDFLRMPYVGGYLDRDQTIKTLKPKNRKRLSGEDRMWSLRSIFPLPTSDSRSADFRSLGTNDTWIKIAEPTVESIRQAFLAHQSRIRSEPPRIPSFVVAKATIKGSTVFRPTALSHSPEFNAIIGGRGTGKSSFLEYVAFGLGRSCYDMPRDHYSGTQRMRELINDTFLSNGGSISLEVIQDNAPFRIVRGPDTRYHPQITYPNRQPQSVSVKELRRLFPAVVYSQGELADIGGKGGKKTRLSDLLQFVSPRYKREDDQLDSGIESASAAVRLAIHAVVEDWKLQSKLRKLTTKRESLKQRAEALEKTLPKGSPNDQAALDYFAKANDFDSKRIRASNHADQILHKLETVSVELLNKHDLSTDLKGDGDNVQQSYRDFYTAFDSGISKLREDLKAKRAALKTAEVEWGRKFMEARTVRDDVLNKLGTQRAVTEQIIRLRREITILTNQIGDLKAQPKIQDDPTTRLEDALDQLRQINNKRDKRTQEWAAEIEQLSSGKIKATVALAANTVEIKAAVDTIAFKTGSHEMTRVKALERALTNASALEVVDRLRKDCLELLHWRQMGTAAGLDRPQCPELMGVLGTTEGIRAAITEHMDITRVEAISTAVARSEIDLHYCDGDREISFEKASDGQRAAALLFMLLEQQGGPLIIDQPEGDLDNRIIVELTDRLHEAKQKRQLVFASHNANLVVNGSAELVGHLDLKESGERHFACTGAIDKPEVCNVITLTMEGGEKAFKDRQDKYGY